MSSYFVSYQIYILAYKDRGGRHVPSVGETTVKREEENGGSLKKKGVSCSYGISFQNLGGERRSGAGRQVGGEWKGSGRGVKEEG